MGPQTLEYSARSKKFAYVADAHCYVFDTSGICRLDSIIPFCETIQSKHIEEQKIQSNLSTDIAKSERIIQEDKLAGMIFGIETDKEIWGGVGLQAIAWSPHEENILAAVTLKTNRLEIWKVNMGVMVAIIDLKGAIFEIKWSPHDPNLLIGREKDNHWFFKIDINTGKQKKLTTA